MEGSTKGFFSSKTVWASLVVIVVQALTILGLDPAAIADTGEWLTSLITLAAAGIAIYGRLAATQRIDLPSPFSPPPPPTSPPGSPFVTALLLSLFLVGPIGVAGAGLGCSPAAPYVAADRATFDAVAPEYARYVDDDARLGRDDKDLRKSTLATWDLRIKAAEKHK